MNWSALVPVIVDVIAHILDQLGNEVRTYWLVFTAFNGNATRPIISGVRADSR
jgi:hypothetical protein